jgi:hypothetical protein
MTNGIRLVGRLAAFERHAVTLESLSGLEVVFEHAISTVMPGAVHRAPRPTSPEAGNGVRTSRCTALASRGRPIDLARRDRSHQRPRQRALRFRSGSQAVRFRPRVRPPPSEARLPITASPSSRGKHAAMCRKLSTEVGGIASGTDKLGPLILVSNVTPISPLTTINPQSSKLQI